MRALAIAPRWWPAVLAFALVTTACSQVPAQSQAPAQSPDRSVACDTVYSAERCVLMGDQVAFDFGLRPRDVVSIAILPDPTPEVVNGVAVPRVSTGGVPIGLSITFRDGSTRQTQMCSLGGGPECTDDPHISTRGIEPGTGYRDLPCGGGIDPPNECATPLPTLNARAVKAARPIHVKRVDIPIDHEGSYEVTLAEGSLANGILSRASFSLADDWPDDFTVAYGLVQLEVRSMEPDGNAFQNYYAHGWRRGVERIEAVLVFSVMRFEPGAVLQLRDLNVE